MRVLVVVEDNEEMSLIIHSVLKKDSRLEIENGAADAAAAIAVAREVQPDLVVLDHFIEGDMMGLEVAPKLKEVAPQAKILLFSDHDLASDAAREPAVDAFLPKRRLGDLLTTVRQLLGLD